MKNKSVLALLLAFSMCFTSVSPALAAENTVVETEDVTESVEAAPEEEGTLSEEENADEVKIGVKWYYFAPSEIKIDFKRWKTPGCFPLSHPTVHLTI